MTKQSSIRTLSAGSIGNFGEIYDFAVFGFSVPILSAHFFPGSDRTAALLSTFAVYAVAFFARPLGGLLFGVMADKVGRVKVMAMTVWLMALGTAVIGLLPTYASIGIAAPALLVFCRIAQGLALGGETTGTTSFILESARARMPIGSGAFRSWQAGLSALSASGCGAISTNRTNTNRRLAEPIRRILFALRFAQVASGAC